MNRIAALAAAALVAASAVHPAGAAAQQDFRWSERMAAGQQVAIAGINGDIRAEPAAGNEVVVTAVRRGRDANLIRVEVVRRDDGVLICAVYPTRGDDGGWHGRDHARDGDHDGDASGGCSQRGNVRANDAAIDFTVRVPAGVRLAANTVSGNVTATGLRSPVRAATVSGTVRVATDGPVSASSVSGDVHASVGRGGQEMRFNSVSGDITVDLASGVAADVEAHTLSGDIESDFPLDRGRRERRRRDGDFVVVNVRVGQQARGSINGGGEELKLNTVSGDITLRRAR